MGRNKYIQCSICSKNIRTDNMKLHKHDGHALKYKMKTCHICNKAMICTNLGRHMKKHDKESKAELINEIKRNHDKKRKEYETGVFIKEFIENSNIDPEILTKEQLKAVQRGLSVSKTEAVLKPWQEKLAELINPSEREIIWIVGAEGNEGKTWFQKYLKNVYGARVFKTYIRKSSRSTLHILSKQFLTFIDLFLFDVSRSFNMKCFPYVLLEDIKDGESIKSNGSRLTFNTPNTLLVFSNEKPDVKQMSRDRWSIYVIEGDDLLQTDGSMVV